MIENRLVEIELDHVEMKFNEGAPHEHIIGEKSCLCVLNTNIGLIQREQDIDRIVVYVKWKESKK